MRSKRTSPETDPHVYGHLNFDKGDTREKQVKDSVFKNGAGQIDICRGKNMALDSYLTPYTKTNSRLIIALNVKSKTVNFLENNMKSVFITLSRQRQRSLK